MPEALLVLLCTFHLLRLLRGHPKIPGLHFFHQRDSDTCLAAIRYCPFQFDTCHGTHRRRHLVQSPFRFRFPLNTFTGPWAEQDVVGDDPLSSYPHILLDFVAHEQSQVGRHTVQPMDRLVSPHHPIDKPAWLTSCHIDPDF